MKRKLLLLALIPMLLTGCDFEPDSLGEDLSSIVSIQGKGEVYYPQEFTLKNDCLDQPSDVFNKDLALFTYGASVANKTKDTIITFYRDMMFSTLEVSSNYDITPTKDTIAYTIGSRMMNHSKVVLVSVRGFNYGAEWGSNFDLGLEGDHVGFTKAANTLIGDLDDYIKTYQHQNSKIILTGYSRGGAVANVAAKILFEREKKLVRDENFYVYTFEAPKGCLEYHDYKNVFNIVNRYDLVPMIAPLEYGFYRVGQDIYIDQENVREICLNYDPSIVIPEFTEFDYDTGPVTQESLPQTLIYMLTQPIYGEQSIDTREKFVNVICDTLDYVFTIFMTLDSETLSKIGEGASEKSLFELLGIITDPDALVSFLTPYLDEGGFVYDADELMFYASKLTTFIGYGPGIMVVLMYGVYGDDFSSMIYMHYPEVNYPLLEALCI